MAFTSLRTRRLRAMLTAGGIAIGIAAMVAVLGVSTSSRADLLATLDALGTDLLAVRPGTSFLGAETPLAPSAPGAIRRIGAVEQAAATAALDATVRRTDRVPRAQTSGLRVAATEASLLDTLQGRLAAGRFFDTATNEHPAVVLGATAARRLGIDGLEGQPLVWLGDGWFAVVGVLEPVLLAPEIDSTALIGVPAATRVLGVEPVAVEPTDVYVRTQPEALDDVRAVLPRAANPESREAVRVSRPSDALAARAAAETAFTALLLGLGGVALLVGGIGIVNVMVIAVLERRSEIGLRRALGATRRHSPRRDRRRSRRPVSREPRRQPATRGRRPSEIAARSAAPSVRSSKRADVGRMGLRSRVWIDVMSAVSPTILIGRPLPARLWSSRLR